MTIAEGTRVHISFDAVWQADWTVNDDFKGYAIADGYQLCVPNNATVEVVEDLREGDVYRSAEGRVYAYVGYGWDGQQIPWVLLGLRSIEFTLLEPVTRRRNSLFRFGDHIADRYVVRPLTLLVRDGQPVTS